MTKLNTTLQNNPIATQIQGSAQDGYVLAWDNDNGVWASSPRPFNYTITPDFDTNTLSYTESFILFSEKIYPLMNIEIIPYVNNGTVYSFSGEIVFPAAIPFVATVNCISAGNGGINFYLASNYGENASILAPTDGYANGQGPQGYDPGRILISGLQNINALYDGNNPGPGYNSNTGIVGVYIGNSTGFDGYIGGIPYAYAVNNNGLYPVYWQYYESLPQYTAQIVNSTSINMASQIQTLLNNYFPLVLTSDNVAETGVVFENGSTIVTGAGTRFLTDNISPGIFINNAPFDGDNNLAEIASIDSDFQITLTAPYAGTSSYYTYYVYYWIRAQVSNTVQFTNGSAILTGTGTSFLSEYSAGQFVSNQFEYRGPAYQTQWNEILSVDSDTQITLTSNYTGTTVNTYLIIGDSLTFINGSTLVTGSSNSLFISENILSAGDWIKLNSDSNYDWAKIQSVNGDSTLTLESPYSGSSATGLTNYVLGQYTSHSFDGYTSYPDTNNGNLTWAALTYNELNNEVQFFNSANTCVLTSDGNTLNSTGVYIPTQEFPVEIPININDGFNSYGFNFNNLGYFVLNANSVYSAFDFGIAVQFFDTTLTNTTSYTATVGLDNGGSFTGTTVTVPPGALVAIFSDGINVIATSGSGSTILPTVTLVGSTEYTIVEPSGTTYIVSSTSGQSILLPTTPADGTQYTFKDYDYTFSNITPFYIYAGGSDGIEINNNQYANPVLFSQPNAAFTLQYILAETSWRVISSNGPLTGVISLTFSQSLQDSRTTCYYINCSGGEVDITIDNSLIPFDGQEISFKDNGPGGSWSNTFQLITTTGNGIEQPSAPGLLASNAVFTTSGNSIKYKYDAASEAWWLIYMLLTD